MIIIFSSETGQILAAGQGYPAITETGGKAYLPNGRVLINNLTQAGWKYIDDAAVLHRDRSGRVTGVASDYAAVTLATSYDEQMREIVDRAYPPKIATRAEKIAWMKDVRRRRLRACDWCIAGDSPLTTAQKTTVTTYRAALRGMGDTVTAAQVDAATTKAQLLALFPTKPAIVDSSM